MAGEDWGQGAVNNSSGWGQAASNGAPWGAIHELSWGHPQTNLVGDLTDPDYQAVLDYATANAIALPTADQQAVHNARLLSWKSAGIWATRDFVFHFEGSNADFALIDWKRLTLATAVNSPSYDPAKGFASNGTSSYIDYNYNPTVGSNQFTTNDAGVLSKYTGDAAFQTTHRVICLGSSSASYLLSSYNATTQGSARMGELSGPVNTVSITDARGVHTMCASKNSIDRTPWIDGSARIVTSITPALTSQALWGLRVQTAYSPNGLFHLGIVMAGAGIDGSQALSFHNSVI